VQQPALCSCLLDVLQLIYKLSVAFLVLEPSDRMSSSACTTAPSLVHAALAAKALMRAHHFGSAHRRLIFASLCARCFRLAHMRLVRADRCLRSFVIAFLDQPCPAHETSDRPIDAWHVRPHSQSAAHDTQGLTIRVCYCRRTAHVKLDRPNKPLSLRWVARDI
jgi:hypothetical protein